MMVNIHFAYMYVNVKSKKKKMFEFIFYLSTISCEAFYKLFEEKIKMKLGHCCRCFYSNSNGGTILFFFFSLPPDIKKIEKNKNINMCLHIPIPWTRARNDVEKSKKKNNHTRSTWYKNIIKMVKLKLLKKKKKKNIHTKECQLLISDMKFTHSLSLNGINRRIHAYMYFICFIIF